MCNSLKTVVLFILFLGISCCSDEKDELGNSNSEDNNRAPQRQHNDLRRLKEQLKRAESSDVSVARKKLSRVFQNARPEALIKIIDEFGSAQSAEDMRVWNLAMLHLSDKNPSAALDRLFQVSDACYKEYDVSILEVLAVKSPNELKMRLGNLAAAKSIVESKVHHFGLSSLAKHSPRDALDLLKVSSTEGRISEYALHTVFSEAAKNDPDNALKIAKQELRGEEAAAALASIAEVVGRSDFEAGLLILREISGMESMTSKALQSLVLYKMNNDQINSSELINILDEKELLMAIAHSRILDNLAKNPDGMTSILDKLIILNSNKGVFNAAVQKLTRASSDKALAWISNLPNSVHKNELYRVAYEEIGQTSIESAIPLLESLELSARKDAMKGIGASWGRKNLDEAIKWGQQLSDATERKNLIASAMVAAVYKDPAKVAEYLTQPDVVSNLNEGERASFMENTAAQYFSKNIDETIDWVSGLGGKDQAAAVKGMVNKWAEKDIQGLGEWLQKMEPGELRDTGVQAMIGQLKDTHPDAAKAWKETLSKSSK